MLNLQLAHKYARAIFLLAQDGKLTEYGEELKRLVADIDDVSELKEFLASPMIPTAAKKETVEKCFAGDYSPIIVNFLCYLIDKQRGFLLKEIARECYEEPEVIRAAPLNSTVHHTSHDYFDDPERWALSWRNYRQKYTGYFQPRKK